MPYLFCSGEFHHVLLDSLFVSRVCICVMRGNTTPCLNFTCCSIKLMFQNSYVLLKINDLNMTTNISVILKESPFLIKNDSIDFAKHRILSFIV
jgi:hypothetical protein